MTTTDDVAAHRRRTRQLALASLFFLILSALLLVYSVWQKDRLSARCLAAGYPESKRVGWNTGYCIGQRDGQDVILPVSRLP